MKFSELATPGGAPIDFETVRFDAARSPDQDAAAPARHPVRARPDTPGELNIADLSPGQLRPELRRGVLGKGGLGHGGILGLFSWLVK